MPNNYRLNKAVASKSFRELQTSNLIDVLNLNMTGIIRHLYICSIRPYDHYTPNVRLTIDGIIMFDGYIGNFFSGMSAYGEYPLNKVNDENTTTPVVGAKGVPSYSETGSEYDDHTYQLAWANCNIPVNSNIRFQSSGARLSTSSTFNRSSSDCARIELIYLEEIQRR